MLFTISWTPIDLHLTTCATPLFELWFQTLKLPPCYSIYSLEVLHVYTAVGQINGPSKKTSKRGFSIKVSYLHTYKNWYNTVYIDIIFLFISVLSTKEYIIHRSSSIIVVL